MDDHSLRVLDFFVLLDILKQYAVSPLGRKRCEALRPCNNLAFIQSRLAEVLELKRVIETVGDPPLGGLREIEAILKKVEVEDSVLTVQELLEITEQIALYTGVKRFFQKLELEVPHLQERVSDLSSYSGLSKKLRQTLTPQGEIVDEASPTLSEIRLQLNETRDKAKRALDHLLHQEELQTIFQEPLITLRNGRYVLLVKSEAKHRLPGIVHDQSQSRMTFFVEPMAVVGLNNEISILAAEEREEEYRILSGLSAEIRKEISNLWKDYTILGELDLLYAMARLSIRLAGTGPQWDARIDLRDARHPLLALQKEKQVVPIHLRMGDGIRTLILSGPNAGGKTVALKTLGLLTLMLQSGLPIPVSEGSRAALFDEVFAVIGDEQSLEDNLSSFSSHLIHLHYILEKAGPQSLVLVDELGAGTDAQEGCALAMGFLDRFRVKGASVVVTTHFDRLKAYGYLHPDVENVAVEFDERTLEPKYSLAYGSSGLSNAFAIAEKLGISEAVLERARHYQQGSDREVSRTLEALEKLKQEVESERRELFELKEEAKEDRQRLKKLIADLKAKRQEIVARAEQKATKAIQKIEEELKAWARQQKAGGVSPHGPWSLGLQRRELRELKRRYFPVPGEATAQIAGPLKVGDRVKIESLRSQGTLIKIEESSKRAEVITSRGTVKAALSDLIKTDGEEEKEGSSLRAEHLMKASTQDPPSEINVIGLTVEEALPLVDKFIDRALLHGLEQVHIIHGIGSGRLRDAIGKYLAGHQGVRRYGLEEGRRGGKGITLVELR